MATDPQNVHVVTTDEIYLLIKQEAKKADQRHRFVTGGAALVLSLFVPGLGMLFLRWYKWAVIYFVGVAATVLASILFPPAFWWRLVVVIVWIVNMVHAAAAAEYEADRISIPD